MVGKGLVGFADGFYDIACKPRVRLLAMVEMRLMGMKDGFVNTVVDLFP